MEKPKTWSNNRTFWALGLFFLWVTSTLLSGIATIETTRQDILHNISQWEPIETAGPDMPIYTKTKEWLLHLFGKWAESDKPKVIASSEDKK